MISCVSYSYAFLCAVCVCHVCAMCVCMCSCTSVYLCAGYQRGTDSSDEGCYPSQSDADPGGETIALKYGKALLAALLNTVPILPVAHQMQI